MERDLSAQSGFRKWLPVLIMSLGLFVVIIDTTIINVAISNVVNDLDTTFSKIQSAITIYGLVMAALLILGGKLGDIFGRKNLFIAGMVIYGIGTLIAAVSQDITQLIFGWSILEGIGGAFMMPATQALIMDMYKGKDRGVAFGIWGGIAGLAVAFGPLAGGFLAANASWRWAFGLELGVVIVVVLAAIFFLKEHYEKKKVSLDIIGSILSAVGLAALVYGVLEARTYGWIKSKQPAEVLGMTIDLGDISVAFALMVTGVVMLTLLFGWLYYRERSGKEPLFSLEIFKFMGFNFSVATMMILLIPMSGIMFSLPVFWQVVKHYDAMETGLTFLPYSAALLVFAPLLGKVAHKISPKYIIQAGILISAFGLFLLSKQLDENSTYVNLALVVGIYGTGMAFFMSQIQHVVLAAVKPTLVGEASGLSGATRQLGSALGTAIMGTIFLTAITTNFVTNINESDLTSEQKTALVAQVESTDALDSRASDPSQEDSNDPIIKMRNKAIIDSNIKTFEIGAVVTLASLVFSFGLPKKVEEHEAENLAKAE